MQRHEERFGRRALTALERLHRPVRPRWLRGALRSEVLIAARRGGTAAGETQETQETQ